MQPNKGIHVEETDASLRLSWNNRTANKKRFLGLVLFAFWVVWTPITLIVTNGAFEKARGFHVIPWFAGLLLAWVCELGVPLRTIGATMERIDCLGQSGHYFDILWSPRPEGASHSP